MNFELPLACLIVFGCTIALTALASQNSRSGWRRQRTSMVVDLLIQGAQMRAAERQDILTGKNSARAGIPVPIGNLIALHTATQVGAGKAPAKKDVPAVPSVKNEVDVTHAGR